MAILSDSSDGEGGFAGELNFGELGSGEVHCGEELGRVGSRSSLATLVRFRTDGRNRAL
jgi:hypothetical protein